jgi:hypothetical protein
MLPVVAAMSRVVTDDRGTSQDGVRLRRSPIQIELIGIVEVTPVSRAASINSSPRSVTRLGCSEIGLSGSSSM